MSTPVFWSSFWARIFGSSRSPGLLDLQLDLGDAGLDVGLLAGAVDDRRVFLLDHHPLGLAQHIERDILKLDAEVFGDRLSASQNSDVLQRGQCFAFDISGQSCSASTE
jgi:hypothetical protein